MNKVHPIGQRFDAFMLALLALAIPVIGYELAGLWGLVVGVVYGLMVGDAVPSRVSAFFDRQPAWRLFLASALIVSIVVVATSGSGGAAVQNATFVVLVLAVQEAIKRFKGRHRQRRLHVEP